MKISKYFIVILALTLAACGGGGGDSPIESNTLGEVTYVEYPSDQDARGHDLSDLAASDVVALFSAGTNIDTTDLETDAESIEEEWVNDDEFGNSGADISGSSLLSSNASPLSTATKYKSSNHALNAQYAYARGYSGKGITIGIIDSPMNSSHTDIADNFKAELNSGATGSASHATAVASIAAGVRNETGIMGVAFGSKIVAIPYLSDSSSIGSVTDDQLADLIKSATDNHNVRIFNNSWGVSSSGAYYNASLDRTQITEELSDNLINAFADAAGKGAVFVWAAGNEGYNTVTGNAPSDVRNITSPFANIPHVYQDLKGHWVNVAAVSEDQGGNFTISDYSNACGASKDWCVVAPGTVVAADSTDVNGGTIENSGTSFAAPAVSGSLALLMQAFPEITTPSIVDALFNGATDLGQSGVDEIYGHGLVNVEESFKELETSGVMSQSGVSSSLKAANLSLSAPVSAQVKAALNGLHITNDNGNAYEVIVNDQVQTTTMSSYFSGKTGLDFLSDTTQTASMAGDINASFSIQRDYNEFTKEISNKRASFKFATSMSDQTDMTVLRGDELGTQLGAFEFTHDANAQGDIARASSVVHPYLNLVDADMAAQTDYAITDNSGVKFGLFSGQLNDDLLNDQIEVDSQVIGAYAAYNHNTKVNDYDLKLQFNSGYMQEDQSLLSDYGTASLSLADQTDTGFAGLAAKLQLSNKWAVMGQAHLGISNVSMDDASLFASNGNIMSQSFMLGFEGQSVLRPNDVFSFNAGVPLHVTHGTLRINVPTGFDETGKRTYKTSHINLAEGDTPLRLASLYQMPFLKNGKLIFGLEGMRDTEGAYSAHAITGLKVKF